MAILDNDLLKKLEQLSRISVPSNGQSAVLEKIGNILADFSLLQNAPVGHLEPLFHYSSSMLLREDVPEKALSTSSLMQNTPHTDGIHYLVPSFIGEGEP